MLHGNYFHSEENENEKEKEKEKAKEKRKKKRNKKSKMKPRPTKKYLPLRYRSEIVQASSDGVCSSNGSQNLNCFSKSLDNNYYLLNFVNFVFSSIERKDEFSSIFRKKKIVKMK